MAANTKAVKKRICLQPCALIIRRVRPTELLKPSDVFLLVNQQGKVLSHVTEFNLLARAGDSSTIVRVVHTYPKRGRRTQPKTVEKLYGLVQICTMSPKEFESYQLGFDQLTD